MEEKKFTLCAYAMGSPTKKFALVITLYKKLCLTERFSGCVFTWLLVLHDAQKRYTAGIYLMSARHLYTHA